MKTAHQKYEKYLTAHGWTRKQVGAQSDIWGRADVEGGVLLPQPTFPDYYGMLADAASRLSKVESRPELEVLHEITGYVSTGEVEEVDAWLSGKETQTDEEKKKQVQVCSTLQRRVLYMASLLSSTVYTMGLTSSIQDNTVPFPEFLEDPGSSRIVLMIRNLGKKKHPEIVIAEEDDSEKTGWLEHYNLTNPKMRYHRNVRYYPEPLAIHALKVLPYKLSELMNRFASAIEAEVRDLERVVRDADEMIAAMNKSVTTHTGK